MIALIRALEPTILCLQEVSFRQLADLREELTEFEFVAGMATGPTGLLGWAAPLGPIARFCLGDFFEHGEFCPILLRRGLAAELASGSFLLGEPEDSRAARGSPTPHVLTWARVWIDPAGTPLWIYNTHLGLLPWLAHRAARELRDRLDRDWAAEPQILAGDFNAPPDGALLRGLLAEPDGIPPLVDLWVQAGQRSGPAETFHAGLGRALARLDYVLARPRLPVLRAMTGTPSASGPHPSDHLALTVEIALGS
jgi:endonuclease/exonuclease/phosphatase family metal-dependent hydrolase